MAATQFGILGCVLLTVASNGAPVVHDVSVRVRMLASAATQAAASTDEPRLKPRQNERLWKIDGGRTLVVSGCAPSDAWMRNQVCVGGVAGVTYEAMPPRRSSQSSTSRANEAFSAM